MKPINQTELKQVQLDILNDIHVFCSENGIRYYLFVGTLLGAIRHQGYIPWDDDIDICMRREDYSKFFETYNRHPDKTYYAINADIDKNYYLASGKVIDTRTIMTESVNSDINIGVYVDVFPMDYFPNEGPEFDRLDKKIDKYRKMLWFKNLKWDKKRGFGKNIIVALSHLLLAPVSRSKIIKKISTLSQTYFASRNTCTRIGDTSVFTHGKKELFREEYFQDTVELDFEGRKYYAPAKYDSILRQIFGEYMELPPKEKQVSHHVFEAYWR